MANLILEISSDEEVNFGNIRKGENMCSELGERDDHDWLTKLLVEVDKKESDDVVLVKEVVSDTPKKPNLEVLDGVIAKKPLVEIIDIDSDSDDEGDDDDCVVLDGDPDKPLLLLGNGDDGSKGGNDSDDVEVVGEKGEVACRDFPHSRHLCAKFIFSSTLHQNHCSQCHCYVCDSLAPCLNWGTGTSSTDHCHASDKEEYWRTERKRKKTGDDKPMPVTIKSFLTQRRQSTQAAPHSLIPRLPCQSLRPATVQPCSMSTNVITSGVVNPSTGIAPRSISPSPRSSNGVAPRFVNPSMGIPPRHTTSNVIAPRIISPRTGIARGLVPLKSSNVTKPHVVSPSTGIAPTAPNVARLRVVNPSTGLVTQRHVTPRSSNVPAPSRGHITPGSPHVANPSTGIRRGHVTPRSSNVNAPNTVNSTGIGRGHITSRPSNGILSTVVTPSVGTAEGLVTSSSPNVITPTVSNPPTGIAQGNTIPPGYKRKLQPVRPLHVDSMGGNFDIEKTSQPFLSPPAAWSGYGNGYYQSQSSREPNLKRCRTLPSSFGTYVSNQQNTMSRSLANSPAPPSQPQLNPEPIPTHPIRATSGAFGNGLPSQASMGTYDTVIDSQLNLTAQPNSSLPLKAVVSNQPTSFLPSETSVSYQTNIGNNTLSSQPQPSTMASSFPSMCNTFENQSSQSHAYNNPSSLSIDDKNGFRQHIQKDLVTDTTNFEMELEAFLGERVQDTSPADNNQYLSVPKGAHDQNLASKDTFQQQSVVVPDSSLSLGVTDCFQYERPMFENQFLSSPLWDEFSPDSF